MPDHHRLAIKGHLQASIDIIADAAETALLTREKLCPEARNALDQYCNKISEASFWAKKALEKMGRAACQ